MMTTTAHADDPNDVWYVDSGASNHMTHHKNWFNELHVPEQPGYVETGDDTVHPIEHVGNVPLAMHDGKPKYMADVLHVPTITKNLVSVGQMVEQGLQVKFNSNALLKIPITDTGWSQKVRQKVRELEGCLLWTWRCLQGTICCIRKKML